MPPGELDRGGTKSLTLQERPDPPRTPRGSGAHQTEVAVAPGLGGSPSAQRRQRLRRARAHGPGPPAPQAAGDAPAFDGHRLDRVAAVLAAPTARRPFPSVHGGPIFGSTRLPTLDAAGGDSIPLTTHLRGRPPRWVGPAGKGAFFAAALSGTHGWQDAQAKHRGGPLPHGQETGSVAARHETMPSPHPFDGGSRPRRRVRGRMPRVREAGARAGDVRGGEGRLLRGPRRRVTRAGVRSPNFREPPQGEVRRTLSFRTLG